MYLDMKETDNYTLTLKHICCLISNNRYSVLVHATFIYTLCISFLVYLTTLFQLLRFFFFCWRYNPLWVLAFSVIFFHSILSLLSFLHPLIPIVWMSSSASSIHLFLGLPLILLPIGFHSSILLGILIPSIRVTCPSQANSSAFLWILLFLHFLWVRSVHGSFWFSKFHFRLVLGQKCSLVFSSQIFLVVVHFDLLMSRPHIRMSLQVSYIFSFKLLFNTLDFASVPHE